MLACLRASVLACVRACMGVCGCVDEELGDSKVYIGECIFKVPGIHEKSLL